MTDRQDIAIGRRGIPVTDENTDRRRHGRAPSERSGRRVRRHRQGRRARQARTPRRRCPRGRRRPAPPDPRPSGPRPTAGFPGTGSVVAAAADLATRPAVRVLSRPQRPAATRPSARPRRTSASGNRNPLMIRPPPIDWPWSVTRCGRQSVDTPIQFRGLRILPRRRLRPADNPYPHPGSSRPATPRAAGCTR